ncbi:MAG TPA: S8 family serine peptidase [Bacteroidia bacterium]|nr:S8 family serine peptidase [Bacteroidia bacterium]
MDKNKISTHVVIALSIALSIICGEMQAQTKCWVKFKNKNGTPYTLSNPTAYMTGRAYLRRITYGLNLDSTDLPVSPSYVAQLSAVPNVTMVYVSKWINGAVIAVSNTLVLNTINTFSFVSSSGPVSKYKSNNINIPDEPINSFNKSTQAAATPSPVYGGSWWQAKQLGVECLHNQGYRGQGMLIAVLDAGFLNVNTNPVFDSLRNRGGIIGTRDFVAGGNSVYEDDQHGAMVLSCIAGIKPNVIMGTAPRADFWLLRTEDAPTEKIIEEYNWIRGAEFADSVGADILTTSLGYTTFDIPSQNHTFADLNGNTSKMSIASRMAARKGMFVLNSAGNGNGGSWPKIGIPADADSICTVGAIDSLYNVAGFSSLGPTADGRIKPDLVARGSKAWVSFPNGSCGYSNGTSFSCPILAGAVACFWQAHKTWNCIKVLDTLKKTASYSLTPNNSRGWGTTNMCLMPPIVMAQQELQKENSFSIVPNPFSSEINIQFAENKDSFSISVISMLGSVVKENHYNENNQNVKLNLEDLSPGVYFIKVASGRGSDVKKIIKQ